MGQRIHPSIAEKLSDHLTTSPEQIAFIENERTQNWQESIENIYKIANGLLELGIQKGDRVAILSRNSIEYSEVMLATLLVGGCMVPLATMITSQSLKLMLEDSESKALFISSEYKELCEEIIGDINSIFPAGKIAFNFDDIHWNNFADWRNDQSTTAPKIKINSEDHFNIIYSSGTTGVPKGILHSHLARDELASGIKTGPEDRNLVSTPLYSNTTMTTWYPTVYNGGTNVIMSKFNAEEALQLIEKHKITGAMFVPVQYDRMLRVENFESYDLSSMKMKFSTSAPLRAHIKRELLDRFPGALVEFYGLTEGGVGTVLIADLHPDKLDSVGQTGPGQELKILDEQGNELPTGKTGEIAGHAKIMSKGYVNREDANKEMFWYDKEGKLFYKSGDIGRLDEDGFLYLLDRKKDIIISGGLNIFATDLEIELLKNPAVHEVAVIAINSEEWGETPLALVIKEEGDKSSEDQILVDANSRLGKSQKISKLIFTDHLPKSDIGKVLKRELREKYSPKPT